MSTAQAWQGVLPNYTFHQTFGARILGRDPRQTSKAGFNSRPIECLIRRALEFPSLSRVRLQIGQQSMHSTRGILDV
jgi:hypothetical protein